MLVAIGLGNEQKSPTDIVDQSEIVDFGDNY